MQEHLLHTGVHPFCCGRGLIELRADIDAVLGQRVCGIPTALHKTNQGRGECLKARLHICLIEGPEDLQIAFQLLAILLNIFPGRMHALRIVIYHGLARFLSAPSDAAIQRTLPNSYPELLSSTINFTINTSKIVRNALQSPSWAISFSTAFTLLPIKELEILEIPREPLTPDDSSNAS